jgi:hypothetical protein
MAEEKKWEFEIKDGAGLVDDGVLDVWKVRNDVFKEEDPTFSTKDGGIIVILLDKTDGACCTSPKSTYWLHIGGHMEQKLLEFWNPFNVELNSAIARMNLSIILDDILELKHTYVDEKFRYELLSMKMICFKP